MFDFSLWDAGAREEWTAYVLRAGGLPTHVRFDPQRAAIDVWSSDRLRLR